MESLAMPLKDIFGEDLPEGAYGECAIRLGDTELYRYYDAMKTMPADTLIVLTRGWVVGSSSDENIYSDYMTLYRAIALFEAP